MECLKLAQQERNDDSPRIVIERAMVYLEFIEGRTQIAEVRPSNKTAA